MKTVSYLRGRPQELYVLDYGLFRVHANGRVIGISGFLIKTDAGECVLIDTGFPEKYARDAGRASQEDKLGAFGEVLALSEENLPAAQLAHAGLSPEEIDLLIISHTHIDHVGGIADFVHAPMIISAAERALDKPLYWGNVQRLEWPDRMYWLIEEDTRIGDGFDVFLAPGHAPGQLAFLIDLPNTGPMLLTSDAISRPAEIEEEFAGSWDETLAKISGARLMKLASDRGAQVIYGHCPEQWPTLRKAPDAYR